MKPALLQRFLSRAKPYALPLACSLVLGVVCISKVLERAGEPALPLDDAFIHLQYAKRLAQGHWFSYTDGGAYSSGATSILWPLAIAPFFALGVDELSVIWVVWLLGIVAHAATALETYRLCRPLSSQATALAAGAMCLAFGAFAWFAFSGMETMALCWVLMRGARVASERREPDALRSFATRASRTQLLALALLAPLIRPEGALVSGMAVLVGLVELRDPQRPLSRRAMHVLLPVAGPLIVPSMHWLMAGQWASATAKVKWLALDPYLNVSGVIDASMDNVSLVLGNVLNGGSWSSIFVPEGMVYPLALGVVAMWSSAFRSGRWWRALMVMVVIVGTLLPCTYATMLWNRVRYIWPFATAWFIAIACLCHELGYWAARRRPLLQIISPALAFGAVAVFAMKLSWATDDIAQSARAIARQQVTLGRWARDALADTALIGVNDTGAIAYMSERRTFDVVGLTTRGEARYWAEGAGARFEHYERLEAHALPSHFIVYPGWMRMSAVLGEKLTQATVMDQSILGGRTMVAYKARYELLGSGALPFSPPAGDAWPQPLAELDVADMESERVHAYDRKHALGGYTVAREGEAPNGATVADGGRIERVRDRFVLSLSQPSRMLMRVGCDASLEVWIGDKLVGEAAIVAETDTWDERSIELPATNGAELVTVRPTERKRFSSYHYWWFSI